MASERECSSCKSLQRVKLQLSQSEEREREFREKLRDVKMELNNKDRQLEVSKRMLARIAADKSQLEVAAEHDKATARKLEARLSVAAAGEGLQAKAARYKSQLLESRELLTDADARLMMAEEARINLTREVHVLKSALGLKTDLPDAALDSHGRMLHALAQSQEESSSLALALADKESALCDGAAALRAARAEVERLLSVRVELMTACEEARGEAGEALELAGVYRREAGAARQEAAHLQEQVQQVLSAQSRGEALLRSTEAALSAQQEKGRQLEEKLATLERAGRLSAEALRSEVSHALERADVRTSEMKAEAAARHAQLTEQLAGAQQTLEVLQAARAVEQRRHEDELTERDALMARMRSERDAAEGEAGEARRDVAGLRASLEEAEEECDRLRAELGAAAEATRRAQHEAEASHEALADERREGQGLRARVEAVDARLRNNLAQAGAREEALQQEVSQLRSEVSASSLVAAKLQQELAATRSQAVDAASQYAHVDNQVEELHATIHSLTQSKAKLQSGLMDQLSAFRDKLSLVEEENRQLRLALGMMGQQGVMGQQQRASAKVEDGRMSAKVCVGSMMGQQGTMMMGQQQQQQRSSGARVEDGRISAKVFEHAVTVASAAAAAARITAIRSPARAPHNIASAPSPPAALRPGAWGAGAGGRAAAATPPSLLERARDRSRALGYEDSDEEEGGGGWQEGLAAARARGAQGAGGRGVRCGGPRGGGRRGARRL